MRVLRVHLAGLPVSVGPDDRLTPDESDALARIEDAPILPGSALRVVPTEVRVTVALEPPWDGPAGIAPRGEPAAVTCDGDRVRIGAEGFRAVVRPAEGAAALFRQPASVRTVEMTMRVLTSCRLPLVGGLPIHAAAIAMGPVGVVFYGVSGAGKSTISSLAPFPVLSDEAVVALPHDGRWEVSSSGFWGTLDRPFAPRGYVPLAGLFELRKEPVTRMERLSARQAYVSLLSVITIPDSPLLWSAATEALGRLVERVPVFRLGWTPANPPWAAIREVVGA